MFVVYTQNPIEKALLEEEHYSNNRHFRVSSKEIHTLVNMLRSILFEHFRGSPPVLAKKVIELVIDTLNMSFSLTLFREIMTMIGSYSAALSIYRSFFEEMSKFTQQNPCFSITEQENSFINELLSFQKTRCTKFAHTTELQKALDEQISHPFITKADKSRRTNLKDDNETILESLLTGQKVEASFRKVADSILLGEENSWWKRDNAKDIKEKAENVKNDSESLIQFQKKGQNRLKQGNINQLIRREAEFDDYLQQKVVVKGKRQEETSRSKFAKRIKERLIGAKLKKRRKK